MSVLRPAESEHMTQVSGTVMAECEVSTSSLGSWSGCSLPGGGPVGDSVPERSSGGGCGNVGPGSGEEQMRSPKEPLEPSPYFVGGVRGPEKGHQRLG